MLSSPREVRERGGRRGLRVRGVPLQRRRARDWLSRSTLKSEPELPERARGRPLGTARLTRRGPTSSVWPLMGAARPGAHSSSRLRAGYCSDHRETATNTWQASEANSHKGAVNRLHWNEKHECPGVSTPIKTPWPSFHQLFSIARNQTASASRTVSAARTLQAASIHQESFSPRRHGKTALRLSPLH